MKMLIVMIMMSLMLMVHLFPLNHDPRPAPIKVYCFAAICSGIYSSLLHWRGKTVALVPDGLFSYAKLGKSHVKKPQPKCGCEPLGFPSQILNLGRDDIPPPHRDSKKFTAPSVLDHLPQVSLFFPGYGISTPLHSRVEVQDGRRRYLPAIPIRIYELGTLFTGYHIIWWSTKSM